MFLLLSLHVFFLVNYHFRDGNQSEDGRRRERGEGGGGGRTAGEEKKEGIGKGGREGGRCRNPDSWDHSQLLPLTSPVAVDMQNGIADSGHAEPQNVSDKLHT